MSDTLFNIESTAAEYREGGIVLPPGWHKMTIINAELKDNSAGTGKFLELHFDTGFKDRLNIFHPSADTQRIGRATLAKICECVGLAGNFALPDVPKLYGRAIDVKLIKESFTGRDGNQIPTNKAKGYAKAGEKSSLAAVPEPAVSAGDDVPF